MSSTEDSTELCVHGKGWAEAEHGECLHNVLECSELPKSPMIFTHT